jgi:transcriptional regulator with GAF, ATPase, and Fis domain
VRSPDAAAAAIVRPSDDLPRPLAEMAARLGDGVRAVLSVWDSAARHHVLCFAPSEDALPTRVPLRSSRNLPDFLSGHPVPRVVHELGEPRFGEERALGRRGFRSYVAFALDGQASRPAAVLFASPLPRRFDAVAVGALLEQLERWRERDAAAGYAAPAAVPGPSQPDDDTVIGESSEFLELCRLAAIVAPQDTTVLIEGESGTGKELLAKTIHRYSRRNERAFVRVNCAALAEALIESEMFGHRKGAFTGALQSHQGRFEAANGGTLLLDEIGNLALAGQAKLLRVLQEREFEPVGQTAPVRVDVRIIATTNVDLKKAIAAGGFREDLYYRLAVMPLCIPPLRARRRDILPLAEHFLERLSQGRLGLDEATRALLYRHDWPGNARELRNAMECAALVARGSVIRPGDLPPSVRPAAADDPSASHLRTELLRVERRIVVDAYRSGGGDRRAVANLLGIDPRNLSYFLKKHAIGPCSAAGGAAEDDDDA